MRKPLLIAFTIALILAAGVPYAMAAGIAELSFTWGKVDTADGYEIIATAEGLTSPMAWEFTGPDTTSAMVQVSNDREYEFSLRAFNDVIMLGGEVQRQYSDPASNRPTYSPAPPQSPKDFILEGLQQIIQGLVNIQKAVEQM